MQAKRILLAAAMLSLAACGTLSTPHSPDSLAAARITPGVTTRADVDRLLGKPAYDFAARATAHAEAAYTYEDIWGYKDAVWVKYDDKGVVTSTFTERLEDK